MEIYGAPPGLRIAKIPDGLRLAATTLSVVGLRAGPVDRSTAAVAMSLAPVIGLCLGAVAAAAALGLRWLGATGLLAGVALVAVLAALTRGLHLDGLADTADGLGSYANRETALAIMRKPDIGPFGVVVLVIVLLAQVASAGVILTRSWPTAAAGVVAAVAGGRVAVSLACRRGVPAARSDGLGALVAGSVPTPVCVAWAVIVAALAIPAVPDRAWQGPLAVLLGLLAPSVLLRHAVRRLGGVTGDVIGAVTETAVTVILVVTSL